MKFLKPTIIVIAMLAITINSYSQIGVNDCQRSFCFSSEQHGTVCDYTICIELIPKPGANCDLQCMPPVHCIDFTHMVPKTECIEVIPQNCLGPNDCPITKCFDIKITITKKNTSEILIDSWIHKNNQLFFLDNNATFTGNSEMSSVEYTDCLGYSGNMYISSLDGFNFIIHDTIVLEPH